MTNDRGHRCCVMPSRSACGRLYLAADFCRFRSGRFRLRFGLHRFGVRFGGQKELVDQLTENASAEQRRDDEGPDVGIVGMAAKRAGPSTDRYSMT